MPSRSQNAELVRLANIAKFLAMNVRNDMEDFHIQNLNDDQMKELNPIIRNAIYSALVAIHYAGDPSDAKLNRNCLQLIYYWIRMIPKYWEWPEFSKSFRLTLSTSIFDESMTEKERLEAAELVRKNFKV